jgi:hypothetical protein
MHAKILRQGLIRFSDKIKTVDKYICARRRANEDVQTPCNVLPNKGGIAP